MTDLSCGVSTSAIAFALGTSRQAVRRRAEEEQWLYRGEGRNGKWIPKGLPLDVVNVLLVKGVIEPDIKERPDSRDELEGAFLEARDKDRETAKLRGVLLSLYLGKEEVFSLEEFVELYNAGYVSKAILDRLGRRSVKTVYKWLKAYTDAGRTPMALVPRYAMSSRKGGAGESLSELAKGYLQYYWLKDSRPSMRSSWLETKEALPGEPFSYATAKRFLDGIPAVKRDFYRRGIHQMEEMDLPGIERNMGLYKSMDQLVSDHHCFDFLVEREGNLFRPWITAVQDFRSSKIVGFWPSVYPSSLSISLAFYLAVSRFGSCKLIHVDNGKDYRSMVLNGGTKRMKAYNENGILEDEVVGIQGAFSLFSERVTFAKPYHGPSKGRMERTFGTFAQLFSKRMLGYVGSNTTERPKDAELYWRALNKRARRTDIHTWDDYVRALASFVDFFNAEWRGEGKGMDGRTPDEVFAAEAVAMRPVSEEVLAKAFSKAEGRTVGKNGIRVDGVRYWDDALIGIVGSDVLIRRYLQKPEEIEVADTKGRMICTARAGYFLETGDLEADNERVGKTRKKAIAMVRDAQAQAIAPPEGMRSLVEFAQRSFPVAERKELDELPLAAGGENDRAPKRSDSPSKADREKANAFLDLLK